MPTLSSDRKVSHFDTDGTSDAKYLQPKNGGKRPLSVEGSPGGAGILPAVPNPKHNFGIPPNIRDACVEIAG